jgi:hypothetical protein
MAILPEKRYISVEIWLFGLELLEERLKYARRASLKLSLVAHIHKEV